MDAMAVVTELDQQLATKYATMVANADWRGYVRVGTQDKFTEGNITLTKHGAEWPLDEEENSTDVADRLATAAARTEYRTVAALFTSAAGPQSSLFAVDLGNLFMGESAILNAVNLKHAIQEMRGFDSLHLVVPSPLEDAMEKALQHLGAVNIVGHVNPFLSVIDRSETADQTWYLFGRRGDDAALRVHFLVGHERPELCIKADSSKFRIRHIFGGAVLNPAYTCAFVGGPTK